MQVIGATAIRCTGGAATAVGVGKAGRLVVRALTHPWRAGVFIGNEARERALRGPVVGLLGVALDLFPNVPRLEQTRALAVPAWRRTERQALGVLSRDIRGNDRGPEPRLQPRAVLPRQDARFAGIPARDTDPLADRLEIRPKADLALATVIILGTRHLFLPEADIRLPEPLRMVRDRGEVEGAA